MDYLSFREIEIEVNGVKNKVLYAIQGDILTISSSFGNKSAVMGGQMVVPEMMIKRLLMELIADGDNIGVIL